MITLETAEDLQWLRETHLKTCAQLPAFAVAVVYGNEDAPTRRIDLYEANHYNSVFKTLEPDADGVFHCDSSQYTNQEGYR